MIRLHESFNSTSSIHKIRGGAAYLAAPIISTHDKTSPNLKINKENSSLVDFRSLEIRGGYSDLAFPDLRIYEYGGGLSQNRSI